MESAEPLQTAEFESWKKAVKSNANLADAAIYFFAFGWVFGGIILFTVSLILSQRALHKRGQANKIGKPLGFPKGFGWIGKASKPVTPILSVPAPEEVEARSATVLTLEEKQVVRDVMKGTSIESAADRAGISTENARAAYCRFYAEFSKRPESERQTFIETTVG